MAGRIGVDAVGGLALGALLLSGCGRESGSTAADPASVAASAARSPNATGSATSSATSSPTGSVEVPVYFVGPAPTGPRLFAELRTVDADDPVDEALAALAAGPHDPDYTTYLRPGALRMESYDEHAVLVVPDATWATRPDGTTDRQARLALQQVVLTLQAALGRQIPIGFTTADLAPLPDGFFGLSAPPDRNGYVAADPIDVLAHVNVTSPAEGEAVTGPFTAHGMASSFEGTVPWQILDGNGRVVARGAGQGGSELTVVTPWTADVDASGLAPGSYTFRAMTDDPTGGTEGPGPTSDTKTITIS